ncbi:hypothetical protein [uncultured Rhodoblastus sp.]|nr:hypothetical protein [uncultured Rhodoblastus sp.]
MTTTTFYVARLVYLPLWFALVALFIAALFALWLAEVIARSGLALVASK